MNSTKIEWCDKTINPVVGCTFNCEYCYARKMNKRFGWIEDFNKPVFFPERLKQLESKKPQNIFMNSMSDVADWEDEWFEIVMDKIRDNPQHRYLFLTKRPKAYLEKFGLFRSYFGYFENVWFGTTYNKDGANYFYHSRANTFLSIEPLLEPIQDLDFINIGWIIIGAETGNRKGKVTPKKEWVDHIVKIAKQDNIPVFMKDSLISVVGEGNMLREFPLSLLHRTTELWKHGISTDLLK